MTPNSNKILQELEHSISASTYSEEHRVLIFTTNFNTRTLIEYLNDDFNFEINLRLLNLNDQLAVRSLKNNNNIYKRMTSKLFMKLVLNYILYIYDSKDEFQPWKELEFSYNEFGKPSLIQQELYKFQFNMSSSNDIISIVVELNTPNPIGIDLSHSRQAISPTKFLEQFEPIFDPIEIQQLLEIKNTLSRYIIFNQLWTLKEAFTKLMGSGLNVDLSKFYFSLNNSMVDDNTVATFNNKPIISKFEIDWKTNINLNVNKLVDERNQFLLRLPSLNFNCYSGILVRSTGDDLPVIISIINQTYSETECKVSDNFDIDFFKILTKV